MANDLNLCQFIGRLGADPDLRYTQGGSAVAKIRIACGRVWKSKDGAKQEDTTWVRVTAFGKLAEIIGQYCAKGQQIYVSGRLQVSTYEKEGQTHYSTEIIANEMQMLGGRPSPGSNEVGQQRPAQASQANSPSEDFDDDIPF